MEVHLREPGLVIATEKNLMGCLYADVPQAAFFERMRQVELGLLRSFPSGMGIFNLIMRPGKMFSMPSAVRHQAAALGTEMAPRTVAIANCVEAQGFFAATARSLIAGVAVLSQNRTPQRTFDRVDEALTWMLPVFNASSDVKLAAADFERVIAALRQP